MSKLGAALVALGLTVGVVANSAEAARLDIIPTVSASGIIFDVDADFDVETVGVGIIFANPCPSPSACRFDKAGNLNGFTASFGSASTTGGGENLYVVSASASAAIAFGGSRALNTSTPRAFNLGEVVFLAGDPGLVRFVQENDVAWDDLLSVAGAIGGDANAATPAEGIIDFTAPADVYTVVPEPGTLVLLGAALAGLAFLRGRQTT
jgi:hypothetical protein